MMKTDAKRDLIIEGGGMRAGLHKARRIRDI